jgi:hypothetical protein
MTFFHRVVDYSVTTAVLLLSSAAFEHLAKHEEIENLIAIQNDLYRFVNNLQPFTVWNSFWKHFSSNSEGLSFFGPIRVVEALSASFMDNFSIDNWRSAAALVLCIFIAAFTLFLLMCLLRSIESIMSVLNLKILVWALLVESVVYFIVKQIMLLSLLTLSWLTHLAAIVIVVSPFVYFVFFKNIERAVTECLIDYAHHKMHKIIDRDRSSAGQGPDPTVVSPTAKSKNAQK